MGRRVFLHVPLKRGKDLYLYVGVNPSHSLGVDVISILFPKREFKVPSKYTWGNFSRSFAKYPFSNCYGCYGSGSSSRPMTLKYGDFGGTNLGTPTE